MSKADKSEGGVFELVKTIVYALLLAGAIRTVFFQPFWIPSGSMKNTLLVGDFLFVNKMAYGYSKYSCPWGLCSFLEGRLLASEPERGDVIVFRHPTSGEDYIKRLIGLPGDRVQMTGGRLYLNGEIVPQTEATIWQELKEKQGPFGRIPSCANEPVSANGGTCDKLQYTETLPNGVSHAVLDTRSTAFDNTGEYIVPEGHYFFMGDNRDNSLDSRASALRGGVGYLPAENIIGRADRVIFSAEGRSMFYIWTWRADRFFKAVE